MNLQSKTTCSSNISEQVKLEPEKRKYLSVVSLDEIESALDSMETNNRTVPISVKILGQAIAGKRAVRP